MRRKRTRPRIRVSKKALRFRKVMSLTIIFVGGVICLLGRWDLGLALGFGGLLGLIANLHTARHASSPLFTGLEIDPPLTPTPQSKGDRLRELQELRDDGIITEEEFEEKHAEVMGEQW